MLKDEVSLSSATLRCAVFSSRLGGPRLTRIRAWRRRKPRKQRKGTAPRALRAQCGARLPRAGMEARRALLVIVSQCATRGMSAVMEIVFFRSLMFVWWTMKLAVFGLWNAKLNPRVHPQTHPRTHP